ncbi:MAG TPA: oxidoreductase [Dyella sp.]|uniref:oxidoreductase n=1 Tax=Dyella sp. TaxID=1869338 RepID=UPI002F9411DC
MNQPKIFLITGVSTGLGRALAEVALREGHRVAGTVRDEASARSFEALAPGSAFAYLLDVTDTVRIAPTVAEIEQRTGPVDVLVNNAGYGHEGVLEEAALDDLRRQFEVNVFGAVAMIQAVLPYMRKRRAGRILNITSMGGIITMPGISFYHGSKFALEGISESLAKEVRSLGIYVTAVAPGGFRTDWAGRSMVRSERRIADYDAVFDPLRERRKNISGHQPGDPHKAGEALLKLVASDDPPMHLLLGRDAMTMVREKLGALKSEFDTWEQVTLSTDFS